jgi:hypothetical protein
VVFEVQDDCIAQGIGAGIGEVEDDDENRDVVVADREDGH